MKNIQLFYPNINKNIISNVINTLNSKYIAQGPQVKQFENEFKNKISNYYPIATNSTTAALHLAYILAGIKENDEVISTVFTCVATSLPLLWLKAKIIFSDITRDTMNIDVKDVEKKITKKTKAIVCINYSGCPCNFDYLRFLADKYKLKLICDNAHGIKTIYKGKTVEEWCDYVIYSFQAIKFITTSDGGMLIVKDEDESKIAKKLTWFGMDKDEKAKGNWNNDIEIIGYKYHMNDLSASMGLAALETLDTLLEEYRQKFNLYKELLGNKIIPLYENNFNSWLCTVFTKNSKKLKDYLKSFDIESDQIHYRNDKYSILYGKRLELPNMNYMEDKYLVLPMNIKIELEDIKFISQKVLEFDNQHS